MIAPLASGSGVQSSPSFTPLKEPKSWLQLIAKTGIICLIWKCWCMYCRVCRKHVCNFPRRVVGQEKCACSSGPAFVPDFSPIERKEGQTSVCASLLLPLLINMLLSKHPTSSGSFWQKSIANYSYEATILQECTLLCGDIGCHTGNRKWAALHYSISCATYNVPTR